jgi:hypothetical protein
LCNALEGQAVSDAATDVPQDDDIQTVPLVYMMDGAYANVDDARLLVDTGSSISMVSRAAGESLGLSPSDSAATLRSRRNPEVVLPGFGVSSQQQFPPGVDGILGINCLRSFAAAEFDWATSSLRLHRRTWQSGSGGGRAVSMPLSMRQVSAGVLPFVTATFGSATDASARCQVDGLVDTGSPVTMVTPELAERAQMVGTPNPSDDIISTGVDGTLTRLRASACEVIALGAASSTRIAHAETVVYAGTCPMMVAVGWQGTPAALLGLDVLRGGVRAGTPKATPAGGPPVGRLVLDFERSELVVWE